MGFSLVKRDVTESNILVADNSVHVAVAGEEKLQVVVRFSSSTRLGSKTGKNFVPEAIVQVLHVNLLHHAFVEREEILKRKFLFQDWVLLLPGL
jgi:hypothetical protein